MENYKSSVVIYESAYSAIEYLQDDTIKWEAIRGLLRYGFYGEAPESDNPLVNMIYVQAIPSMQSAKQRYDKAVANGKKGGRPADVPTEEIITMKSNGMTNKQIAEKMGCTTKNIENRVAIYNKSHPNNPNNLSVSVSVSESDSVSVANAKKTEEGICVTHNVPRAKVTRQIEQLDYSEFVNDTDINNSSLQLLKNTIKQPTPF